ncbi:MAG: phosphoribosylformylglycinamidine synthase subunit PurL [Bacteroidota bacterium]
MDKINQPATLQMALDLGLLKEEFEKIIDILGRTPNFTELSIFSVMWSEHCSYKNSIQWLKTLPRDGKSLLVAAGEENAGLVDIGDGMACAFKIESHNHPSAVEPYQGAATGVGGIHRDIFTMGARPIAALNSLRFGNIDTNRTKWLLKGVVRGIGDYGNCFGVPTVGGEVYFHPSYNQNILVNAMSVGIVDPNETVSAIAEGVGNPIYIVGSATGKDGIHGATFASAELHEDSHEDLPSVQVGDPFQEKLLLEASLEAIKTGVIVGMQDMGAAGITCSTSEMSAKGNAGMVIDLDKVPTRQGNMKPFEILLSESQERMLIVCEKGKEAVLEAVFDKWDLECEIIGEVTDSGRLEFFKGGQKVADVPAEPLVLGGGAPVYDREYEEPGYVEKAKAFDASAISVPADLKATAEKMLESPNLASKKWVYEQYDSMVRTNTMNTNDPADAAIIRLKGTKKALLATTDCNSSYVYADPHKGAMIAVSEAARNIVCTGGTPVAITNCLNFGNPYDKGVYWQFVNAIKGMGEACRKFETPVTGGNVSFYNQSVFGDQTEPVFPTPTIGMLGVMEDVENRMTLYYKSEGDHIFLIGNPEHEDINSSEYLRVIHRVDLSPAPHFDLDEEYFLQQIISKMIKGNLVESVHDVSEGGLFFALLESGMHKGLGFNLEYQSASRKDAFLFGEAQSRVVVSVKAPNLESFLDFMDNNDQQHLRLGHVTSGAINVWGENYGDITTWVEKHNNVIHDAVEV